HDDANGTPRAPSSSAPPVLVARVVVAMLPPAISAPGGLCDLCRARRMSRSLAVSAPAILHTPAQARPPGGRGPIQHPSAGRSRLPPPIATPARPSPAHVRLASGHPGHAPGSPCRSLRHSQIAMTMEIYSESRQARPEVRSSGWAGNSIARVAVRRPEKADPCSKSALDVELRGFEPLTPS